MDKWLEKDIQVFAEAMAEKDYTSRFMINNKYMGDLRSILNNYAELAYKEEEPMFPLILTTYLKDTAFNVAPILTLKVGEGDYGLKILNAEVEGLIFNGVMKNRVSVSFKSVEDFPTNQKLIETMINKFSKRKGKKL